MFNCFLQTRQEVLEKFNASEKIQKKNIEELFEDVYDELTPNLIKQRDELQSHLKEYGNNYPMDKFENNK